MKCLLMLHLNRKCIPSRSTFTLTWQYYEGYRIQRRMRNNVTHQRPDLFWILNLRSLLRGDKRPELLPNKQFYVDRINTCKPQHVSRYIYMYIYIYMLYIHIYLFVEFPNAKSILSDSPPHTLQTILHFVLILVLPR